MCQCGTSDELDRRIPYILGARPDEEKRLPQIVDGICHSLFECDARIAFDKQVLVERDLQGYAIRAIHGGFHLVIKLGVAELQLHFPRVHALLWGVLVTIPNCTAT